MSPDAHPVIGIFASDHGPGDAERATIMSQAGSYLARKGARLACVVDTPDDIPVPLLTSARTAGGEVIAHRRRVDSPSPTISRGVTVEHIADRGGAPRAASPASRRSMSRCPGSLSSAISALHAPGCRAVAAPGRKPVVFLDHHGAFKVVRGYAADVHLDLDQGPRPLPAVRRFDRGYRGTRSSG